MGIIIDSSILIAIERANADLASVMAEHASEVVAIAAVTAAELLHGVHRASDQSRRKKRNDFVENILTTVPIIAYDLEVAREHARLWADLMQRGELIGPHDMQIAATCLATGFAISTMNEREFRRIAGLHVENWFAE